MKKRDFHKRFPCANPDCPNIVYKRGGLCRQCYLVELHKKSEARIARKREEREIRRAYRSKLRERGDEAKRRKDLKRMLKMDRKFRAEQCGQKPVWKLKFVKVGEDVNGKPIKHEIGECADFKNGLCGKTGKPCPLNGRKDFTLLQMRESRISNFSRGVENLGVLAKGRPIMEGQRGRRKTPMSSNPAGEYRSPLKEIMPLEAEGNSWDDLFKMMKQ